MPSSGRVRRFICFCDWADNVLDIHEQLPLKRELTLKIAEDLDIKYPVDTKTNTPIVILRIVF